MSGKIRKILFAFICIGIDSGCQNMMVPAGYRSAPNQIDKSITGGWVEVSVIPNPSIDTITMLSGELIAVDYNNTFHILTAGEGLISLNKSRISAAKLYFFSNPNVSLLGFLGVIPNIIGAISQPDYAGPFLLLGIPLFVTSLGMAIADYQNSNSTLRYPVKNSMSEFSKYARFPQGLPPDLQKEKLHLVIK
jgi:hypothetical protein